MGDWMIYGATGYTGKLVAEEAVRRGHKPLLAGRSAAKLRPLAESLGLEYAVVSLDDADALAKAVGSVELVYNAAGPFIFTSDPILKACLQTGVHYLDITGEVPVYQNAYSYDAAAREKGIAIIPGVGFDVLPSDSLIKYVANQMPDALYLEVAVDALAGGSGGSANDGLSAGTAKSMVELLPTIGTLERRNTKLETLRMGSGQRKVRFPHATKTVMPASWGDVEVAYRTTGIPNIKVYLSLPPMLMTLSPIFGSLLVNLLKIKSVRNFASRQIERMLPGPSEKTRLEGRSAVYVSVRNGKGETREAWLETLEGYQFTMIAGVRVVERVLDGNFKGALTPSQAFGADFVLEIEGTTRYDSLPS
ncbi:MAG: saccharopine dehydrogenase NADP-binding domain-containing protein [Anaerolineae bacterium]|nr:saccharopine dehydrogenase NADP-binding domain-containing protein [Anaerolineae bacterium]